MCEVERYPVTARADIITIIHHKVIMTKLITLHHQFYVLLMLVKETSTDTNSVNVRRRVY
jgi:hypothetical protein